MRASKRLTSSNPATRPRSWHRHQPLPSGGLYGPTRWRWRDRQRNVDGFVPATIVVLVSGHLIAGDLGGALLVAVGGGTLIAWLPDLLIRPRIASRTADLSGSLYFIGFVGGLLSLGAIGIIVGPLVVALLVESAALVSHEFEIDRQPTEKSTESGQPTTEPADDD